MAKPLAVMRKITEKLAFASQVHEDIRIVGGSHVEGDPAVIIRDGDAKEHVLVLQPKKNH